jgi:tRNA(His) guanylyltransferase
MENREIFSNLRTIPPIFVRLDGRAFHRLTRTLGCEKPYDARFCRAMCGVCRRIMESSGMTPSFAYTFSDEVSLFFPHLPFDGRVEKIDSVCASYAASSLVIELGCTQPVAFDARVIPASDDYAVEYLVSRQKEAWRNHLNAYAQDALIREGSTPRAAAAALKDLPSRELHEMMFARGVNLSKTPAWQRRGILVFKESVIKEGYNPRSHETVAVERRVVRVEKDPPLFSTPEGAALIRSLLPGP